jgi:hypothetical protein
MHMAADRRLDKSTIIAASGNPLGDRMLKLDIRRGAIQLRPGRSVRGVHRRRGRAPGAVGQAVRRSPAAQHLHRRALGADARRWGGCATQVRTQIDEFAAGTVAQDDITFVLCHYDPIPAGALGAAG